MLVLGAGGLAIQMLDILLQKFKEDQLVFFDETEKEVGSLFSERRIVRSVEDIVPIFEEDKRFILAFAGPENRREIVQKMLNLGGQPELLLAGNTTVSSNFTKIGVGTVVLHNSVVEGGCQIGEHVLINLHCSICHESEVGDFTEIGPGTSVLGRCNVGKNVKIGAGSTLLPGIEVGDNTVIGAGTLVNKNLPSNAIAIGVPCKLI